MKIELKTQIETTEIYDVEFPSYYKALYVNNIVEINEIFYLEIYWSENTFLSNKKSISMLQKNFKEYLGFDKIDAKEYHELYEKALIQSEKIGIKKAS